jgi:hypothetical protein
MQLDATDLGNGGEALDTVDLQVGFLVTEDFDQFQQVWRSRHRVALEELLAVNAIRGPDDRARPALDMIDEPRPDRFVILRKLDLGHGLVVAGIRP